MANIYEQKSEEIHMLLDKASATGATVVVPDLQRPYVWEPNQVVLLLDSLVRGWPFGTLLMWKVNHEELDAIPHREFWQVVDRTENGVSERVIRRDPPAQYQMVLDGQQRLQSLLLALCGDGWGFKLTDREWLERLTGSRKQGRTHKHPHWSKGTLCFDVEAFLREYNIYGDVIGIDYREVLKWAVTDPTGGQSTWPKPDNYVDPLPRAFADGNTGKLVRLSRLWEVVSANPNFKEKQFRDQLEPFLEEQGTPSGLADRLLNPMGELMSTLRDVKLSKITYLELRPYDPTLWNVDEYNGAVVNIFTRLNTAGRTLTREEITFAWLKVGWDTSATDDRTAGQCFKELLEQVHDRGLKISMDELVRAVSFIWSVAFRGGELLADKDLLKGQTVQPMAGDLARAWSDIVDAIVAVQDIIQSRGLGYGQNAQYNSMNAVSTLWAWQFLALHWLRANPQNVVGQDSYEKSLASCLEDGVDRWLICSHWAGLWSSSATTAVAAFARDLNKDLRSLESQTCATGAKEVLLGRMQALLDGLVSDAVSYVSGYSVDDRKYVSRYMVLLWVWHRLDARRWRMSQTALRTGRKKACRLEVDHTVAHALWERRVAGASRGDVEADLELLQVVNRLGNCALLEKTFNISKSDQPARAFLEQVHEFASGSLTIGTWASALGLGEPLLSPVDHSVEEVVQAIEERDREVREELEQFVRGERIRQDV